MLVATQSNRHKQKQRSTSDLRPEVARELSEMAVRLSAQHRLTDPQLLHEGPKRFRTS
jgi:hypothetical protein